MSAQNGQQIERDQLEQLRSVLNEEQGAQSDAQRRAHNETPIVDVLEEEGGTELIEKLTDPDVESSEFEDIEADLSPFLSIAHMLASHEDDEYYDELGLELLNENKAERIIKSRERGRLLTGPFLEVAQDVEGETGGTIKTPYSPRQAEAVREILVNVRGSRESLGFGELLSALTEIHVSSEVRREDETSTSTGSGGGLLSTLNPFS